MEEVCGVGPENLRQNFRIKELFSVIFRCRKSLVMSAPKPDIMQLF